MKKQLGLDIDEKLREALYQQARLEGMTVTSLLEDFISEGLARKAGKLVESSSLPAIRAAVREEVAQAISQLRGDLGAELKAAARKSDDRLAGLIVKAARSAGIAHRMVYTVLAKMVNPDYAMRASKDAEEKVGRELSKPVGS